ncbi:MAG: hypothetical protein LBH70_08970 [Spirochaetaceae bacterium]|nr:hypothetical protein [Spirochaetaceae bacterium]
MHRITRDDAGNRPGSLIERNYQNTSINGYLETFKTMMTEAAARKIIPANPVEKMERLVNDWKEIKIITREEFKKLFAGDWRRVWDDNRISCTANELAALTGMSAGEVPGLKGGVIYEDHICLCKQYDEYGYRDTKTKNKHNVPLPREMINYPAELKAMNGEGFVFFPDGGLTTVCRKVMYEDFHRALRNIQKSDILPGFSSPSRPAIKA